MVAGDALAPDAGHVAHGPVVHAAGDERPGGALARRTARRPVAPGEVDELDPVSALDLGAVLVGVVARVRPAVGAEALRPAVRVAGDLDVVRVLPDLDRVDGPALVRPSPSISRIRSIVALFPSPRHPRRISTMPGLIARYVVKLILTRSGSLPGLPLSPLLRAITLRGPRAREPGVRAHDPRPGLAARALADRAQGRPGEPSLGADRANGDRVAAAAEDSVDRGAARRRRRDHAAVARDPVAHGAADGAPADRDRGRRRRVHAHDRLGRLRRSLAGEHEGEGSADKDGEEPKPRGEVVTARDTSSGLRARRLAGSCRILAPAPARAACEQGKSGAVRIS